MTDFYLVLGLIGIIAATIIILAVRVPAIWAIVGAIVIVFGALQVYAIWQTYPVITTIIFVAVIFGLGSLTGSRNTKRQTPKNETIAEAMKSAGHDGIPRNFILNDGSTYSGKIYSADGTKRIETSITPSQISRIEYP